jgi:outer membrane immunogenic protein
MKKFAVLAAAAAAIVATPALAAGEGRLEARGGIAFAGGNSEAFAGIAAGYDFDLGDKAFLGVEVSGDKVLANGADVIFGVGARLGAKAGDKGRAYVIGGMGFADGESDPFLGLGYQHKFGDKVFGKIEYRRVLISNFTDVNFAGVGIGAAF